MSHLCYDHVLSGDNLPLYTCDKARNHLVICLQTLEGLELLSSIKAAIQNQIGWQIRSFDRRQTFLIQLCIPQRSRVNTKE